MKVKTKTSTTVNSTQMLYDATNGSGAAQSDLAHIDIPNDSKIMTISGTVRISGASDGDYSYVEVSTQPTFQGQTNGARGVLFTLGCRFDFQTSGGAQLAENGSISFPGGLYVRDGERVYIHAIGTNAVESVKNFVIGFAELE